MGKLSVHRGLLFINRKFAGPCTPCPRLMNFKLLFDHYQFQEIGNIQHRQIGRTGAGTAIEMPRAGVVAPAPQGSFDSDAPTRTQNPRVLVDTRVLAQHDTSFNIED